MAQLGLGRERAEDALSDRSSCSFSHSSTFSWGTWDACSNNSYGLGSGRNERPDLGIDFSRGLAVGRKVDFVCLALLFHCVVLAGMGVPLGPDLLAVLGHPALWTECW